jgi:ABC-type spermidine/putrescine transport system permease subunit I
MLGSVINDQINTVDNWPLGASLSFFLIVTVLIAAVASIRIVRVGVQAWARW